jgi:hypothetical protein
MCSVGDGIETGFDVGSDGARVAEGRVEEVESFGLESSSFVVGELAEDGAFRSEDGGLGTRDVHHPLVPLLTSGDLPRSGVVRLDVLNLDLGSRNHAAFAHCNIFTDRNHRLLLLGRRLGDPIEGSE